MFDQLSLQQCTDIGFMLLVCFVCAKVLFGQNGGGDVRRAEWRSELSELEASLRGLIAEASTASSALDRNLLQRKRELEQLLAQLEGHEQKPIVPPAPVSGYNRSKKPNKEAAPTEELPNPTWGIPATSSGQEPAPVPSGNATSEWSLGSSVLQGAKQQEQEGEVEDPLERETFAQMSIMDPITYKVARRLLIAGKEIHVVARKLELPISEIRLLDRLMRREQAIKFKDEPESKQGSQGTARPVRTDTDFRLTMAPEQRDESDTPTIVSGIEIARKSGQAPRTTAGKAANPLIDRETALL